MRNKSMRSLFVRKALDFGSQTTVFLVIKGGPFSAYVPQKISIDWTMPLRVIDFMNLTSHINKDEIIEALELTGVQHLIYNEIHNLSGGEFQRVLIARAIAKKPDLLVLDEPVQGVDFNGEIALYNLIKEICTKLNCGILLISHDLHFVMSATDHVI